MASAHADPSSADPIMSVVMPTLNAERTLAEQLGSLAAQDLTAPWELVLVDNGSTDGTAAIAAGWMERLPNLRVVRCEKPGANSARNVGVRSARAPLILTCDSDDRVQPSWARVLVESLETWSLVGGATRVDELNDPETIRTRPNPMGGGELPRAFDAYPYAIGANFAFRREVFDAIDGFDEDFLLGADEIDFCWRAQYAGFEVGFQPEAVVQYRLRDTTRGAMRQTYIYARGDIQLYKKHQALGALPKVARHRQVWRAWGRTRPLFRIDRYFRAKTRPFYLRRVARCGGAFAGCARYRLFV